MGSLNRLLRFNHRLLKLRTGMTTVYTLIRTAYTTEKRGHVLCNYDQQEPVVGYAAWQYFISSFTSTGMHCIFWLEVTALGASTCNQNPRI